MIDRVKSRRRQQLEMGTCRGGYVWCETCRLTPGIKEEVVTFDNSQVITRLKLLFFFLNACFVS